ncbi:aspartyl protease family protein [Prevotella sp. 10(H)]|uniref:aspartyl protease family protein n=1 Tax=Prevotella sp. 10(H) TaxID=1158294 RepID=UPI0004A6C278|nr:aspartyl protease family protein [Prevotella sp. 10(H)]
MRFSFFIFFFSFTYFCIAQSDTVVRVLPAGAVPFHSFKSNVILDGLINDSVPIKALLDIGAWGLAVPERLRKDTANIRRTEQIRFKVGDWAKTMSATFMKPGSQFLHWYGDDCVLLGWDFFNRRILEVSYEHQYIRELKTQELNSLQGYDCIKFENRGRRLLIPVVVEIGGNKIEGNCWIDTGLNGTLFFAHNILAKYNLDTSKLKAGRAKNLDTNRTEVNFLKADTIAVGNTRLINKDVIFTDSEWFVFKENDMYIGLLGNQFFRYFSVIFDFRKNNLYLKPVSNY